MSSKKNTLVFVYNSYKDPLFQHLILTYLKTLSGSTSATFHLITFEQEAYAVPHDEMKEIRQELSAFRIYWHPLTFHTGRWLLLKKAIDLASAVWLVMKIRLRHQTTIIFAFANVSAAFSVVFSRLFAMKLVIYSYEPHSEFMRDMGYWSASSMKYRLLRYFEQWAGRRASVIFTGTQYMVDDLRRSGVSGEVIWAPTAVDPQIFQFREQARKEWRRLFQVENKHVYVYAGKFGGLYYEEELIVFFGALARIDQQAFFLIVTPTDHQWVMSCCQMHLPKGSFHVTKATSASEMTGYLSAADIGIGGIPPSPAQRYRSPTKTAEYLLCGLPYITARGVSEDDLWAEKAVVGVVLAGLTPDEAQQSWPRIVAFFDEEPEVLRERCRTTGLHYRSKERIDQALARIWEE